MKILIIEDDEKLAQSVKLGLEKEGYAADYLTEGIAAQRRLDLSHKEYDLVILDLMLPDKPGDAICQEIRKKNIMLPILVLTGVSDMSMKVKVLNMGADDYLMKPFTFAELLARIKALLRRPVQSLTPELKVADLTLNTVTRKVYRGPSEVPLTLKEFSLLEYLMRHANQVLNREQIYDHSWDFASNSFSNVIDVHMKNLRAKIDNEHEPKLLETIRGVGYRIRG